jgi:1,4-dihydroxy-2-naphthoate octaprenyltransferase
MQNVSRQARIGSVFKGFGYLCFVIAIVVMYYHDSRHLPSKPLGAIFFGFIPGFVSWLVGWAIQQNETTD